MNGRSVRERLTYTYINTPGYSVHGAFNVASIFALLHSFHSFLPLVLCFPTPVGVYKLACIESFSGHSSPIATLGSLMRAQNFISFHSLRLL